MDSTGNLKKTTGKTQGAVFNEMLQSIFSQDNKPLIVGGDFNINLDKIEGPNSHLGSSLNEWCINNSLEQLIEQPTWRRCISVNGQNVLRESRIDHLYANVPGKMTQKHELGDHDVISFECERTTEEFFRLRVRDWRKLSVKRVNKFIEKKPLGDLNEMDIDNKTSEIGDHFLKIMDKCAPWRTIRLRLSSDHVNVKLEAKKKEGTGC